MKTITATATLAMCLLYLSENANAFITIPLKSRAMPGYSTNAPTKARSCRGVDVPLRDWIKQNTDLQWYGPVKVGTPPQVFNVIFDTGSVDLVIAENNCTTCGRSKLFDPSISSTYSSEPGLPMVLSYGTNVDTTPLPAQGGNISGRFVTDTVSVEGLSVSGQQFLLSDYYGGFLKDGPFDGIMGIGLVNATELPSKKPWYWSLYYSGHLASPVVSFYLPPGKPAGAEMTLGGINPARYTGDIQYTPLSPGGGLFIVEQPAMYIGGQQFSGASSQAILDTGTAFLAVDDATAAAIYAQVSPKIKKIDPLGAWGAACDELDALAVDLTFTFGSGNEAFNVTLPKSSFNLGPYQGQPSMCQGVINSLVIPLYKPTFLLGAALLKQYYTVWDGLNLRMGFAKPTHGWI